MRPSTIRTIARGSRLLQQSNASTSNIDTIDFPEFVGPKGAHHRRTRSALRHQDTQISDVTQQPHQQQLLGRATEEQDDENALVLGDDDIPPVRRSEAAKDGSSKLGMVELPMELQLAVNKLIEANDKSLIRQRALSLYEYFRSSTSASSVDTATRPFLDGSTALAYTAGVMPSVYSSTLAVMREARSRFESAASAYHPEEGENSAWTPKKIVDWGAGVGSGAWAAQQAWPDSPFSYVSLDSSRAMQAISSSLLSTSPILRSSYKLHQTSIGSPDLSSLISSSYPDIAPEDTMALCAYTLGDLPSEKVRREVVRSLWDSGAEVIVVIDRGTPKGFRIVADARDQLLRLGRHEIENAARQTQRDIDEADEMVIGGETFVAEKSSEAAEEDGKDGTDASVHAGADAQARGCCIVAPCPHDGICPLHKSKHFCHFSQRVQRPAFLRKTKHSSSNEESSSYSYFILRRGSRPITPSSTWPRLVVPPLKRGGHVILDACCPSGKIERSTIARSRGKQEYYDARKSRWGDLFPHWDEVKSREKAEGKGLSREN